MHAHIGTASSFSNSLNHYPARSLYHSFTSEYDILSHKRKGQKIHLFILSSIQPRIAIRLLGKGQKFGCRDAILVFQVFPIPTISDPTVRSNTGSTVRICTYPTSIFFYLLFHHHKSSIGRTRDHKSSRSISKQTLRNILQL